MASRRNSTRNLPVQHSNATENMEQKLKRLRPDLHAGLPANNDWQWQHNDWHWQSTWHGGHHVGSSGPGTTTPHQAGQSGGMQRSVSGQRVGTSGGTQARKDEPSVRRLTRGTTADALRALRSSGANLLIEDLVNDRYAKGTAEANRSLVRT